MQSLAEQRLRPVFTELTMDQKYAVAEVKQKGIELTDMIIKLRLELDQNHPKYLETLRVYEQAEINIESGVMWAVKGITTQQ